MSRNSSNTRQRSRSPKRSLFGRWFGARQSQPSEEAGSKLVENPEEKMHKWAEKSSQPDATRVKELMDNMEVADFEKYKMVAVFKCKPDSVAEKLRQEFAAKKFPTAVIDAVIDGICGLKFYEKNDSHFEHTGKTSDKGKSNLYQYALWCKLDAEGLMDVGVWCITAMFKKGSAGTATKNEIDCLKQFMDQEMRGAVLHIANQTKSIADKGSPSCVASPTPGDSLIAYATSMQSANKTDLPHEDELINRMEITGFTKYRTNAFFKCPKTNVVSKVKSELLAKKFPAEVVSAVTEGLNGMESYKKEDENFMVHANNGQASYHKYAIWCASDDADDMEVSMLCIAATFKKKSNGPATKSEVEILGQYLGKEACVDILKVHKPDMIE